MRRPTDASADNAKTGGLDSSGEAGGAGGGGGGGGGGRGAKRRKNSLMQVSGSQGCKNWVSYLWT